MITPRTWTKFILLISVLLDVKVDNGAKSHFVTLLKES